MKNDDENLSISALDEIILNIFGFLDVTELLKVSLVCKRWHRIANDNGLWRNLVLERWPSQEAVLCRVSTLALQWQKMYRYLSNKGCYSPDDMKYFIVCKVSDPILDCEELRLAFLIRAEEMSSLWEKPGHYELEETSPRFFNNNMELYYDTYDLKWVFVDRRREYVDDSFTIRLNLDRMSSRQMRFIRPYQVMASCVMMYRWLVLFKRMFTEDIGLSFYRVWRFRLKHIKTGLIFETYDWKAAMSSTFSHGCPLSQNFMKAGLDVLEMLSSPFFVTHPMGNNAFKICYEVSLRSDSSQPSRSISRSSSVETLDSGKSELEVTQLQISQCCSSDTFSSNKSTGSDEADSEENGDESGYFCNCENFIHRSSWEYEEQQMTQAETAGKWEVMDTQRKPTFEVIFDSCEERWLFCSYNLEKLQSPPVLNRKLIDRSLECSTIVNDDVFVEVTDPLRGASQANEDSELVNSVSGQEAMPSSLMLYRLMCLFELNSSHYRSLDDCSIWSVSLQHRLTRGIVQLRDLNGWLRVFVTLNEELKLYCTDLAMMSLNQNLAFLYEPKGLGSSCSKVKGEDTSDSNSVSETGSETSEDDFGNPLEKLKSDVCSLLQLLVSQKFAHPYGTVAGAVA